MRCTWPQRMHKPAQHWGGDTFERLVHGLGVQDASKGLLPALQDMRRAEGSANPSPDETAAPVPKKCCLCIVAPRTAGPLLPGASPRLCKADAQQRGLFGRKGGSSCEDVCARHRSVDGYEFVFARTLLDEVWAFWDFYDKGKVHFRDKALAASLGIRKIFEPTPLQKNKTTQNHKKKYKLSTKPENNKNP